MLSTDRAESFYIREGDIWVRMRSGREIKLGPLREVSDSMRGHIADPKPFQAILHNKAS